MGTGTHSEVEPRGTRGGTKLIQQVEQRHFIVTLRRRGMSFAQIAEALEAQKGITMEPASVAQYVQRAKLNGLNSAKRVEHHHTGSLVHELGTDPHEIAREREAWLTAGGDASDSDIVDIDAIPVPDA
jgi:DNA-binding transcriptional MerR regulator